MASSVDIGNLALGKVGLKAKFMSFSENTAEAAALSIHYPLARDAVLEANDWWFARKFIDLAELAIDPIDGWAYVYTIPAACLAPRRLAKSSKTQPPIPYEIMRHPTNDGWILMTNEPGAKLVGTFTMENTAYFSPGCVDAIAWKLGCDVSAALGVNPKRAEFARDNFLKFLAWAATTSANQEFNVDNEVESDFISSR